MGEKDSSDIDRFAQILEDNSLYNVHDLKEIDEKKWLEMNFPIGLIFRIKNELTHHKSKEELEKDDKEKNLYKEIAEL